MYSLLSPSITNGSIDLLEQVRPAFAAQSSITRPFSPYSSAVIGQAGIHPSPYWPVRRSMRGPCPATHTSGLPRSLSSGIPMRPDRPISAGIAPVSSRARSSWSTRSHSPTGAEKS
jgi:hypothetical protein